jgi:phage-related minor tail protein
MYGTNQQLANLGMTAKATAAAMRSVPAQFTDVVVSLQGGQAPLTVLLQQGGQLKDMFGGIGNATRALGSYISGLITPFSVAAVAAATLGVAYYQGAKESESFRRTVIETGNAAGVTAVQLQSMAASVSRSAGITQGAAAEALNAFAAGNTVAVQSFERFSAIAVRTQTITGVAVADTVKQFQELGKSPVEASIKLNETTNFLTASIFSQIKALAEQGKTAEAAAVAQNALANAAEQRLPQLAANLGTLERSWNAVASTAKGAWGAMLNIGRPIDPVAKANAAVDAAEAALARARDRAENGGIRGQDRAGDDARIARLGNVVLLRQQEAAVLAKGAGYEALSAAYQKQTADQTAKQISLDATHDKYLSEAVRKERAIADAKRDAAGAPQTEDNTRKLRETLAGIEKQYAPKVGPKDTTNAFQGEQDAAKEWAKAMLEADKISDQARGKIDELSKGQLAYRTYLESTAAAINDKVNPAMGELLKRKFEVARNKPNT